MHECIQWQGMRKTNTVQYIALFLFSIIGIWLLWSILREQDPVTIIDRVLEFGVLSFAGFACLSFVNFGFTAWRWSIIINAEANKAEHIPARSLYFHRMAGYGFGYLTPAPLIGGEPVRIALAAKQGASLSRATSSAVLDTLFDLSANIIFVITGILLAIITGFAVGLPIIPAMIGIVFTAFLLGSFFWLLASGYNIASRVFSIMKLDQISKLKKPINTVVKMENQMADFLSCHQSSVAKIAILSSIVVTFRIVEIWYIAFFFGLDLSFTQLLLLSTLPGIALFAPVPAGVGVFEGSFTGLFQILGIASAYGLAFTVIIRARDLLFIAVGMLHLFLKGQDVLRKAVKKQI